MADNESSELKQAFKDAVLAIKFAGEIMASMSDVTYSYAEDLSDQIAKERKMYQVTDFHKRFEIEGEIQSSLAFFGKILPSYLIILIALLEDGLQEICFAAAQAKNVELPQELSSRLTTDRAMTFFSNDLEVQFPDPWPAWEAVQEIQILKNRVTNSAGLNEQAEGISDEALEEFCQTMITFLEELQEHLITSPENEP